MKQPLVLRKCLPCEGGVQSFTPTQVQEYAKEIPEWEVIENKKIRKEFTFKNFREALAFVNKVGEIAESEGHHPDIHLVSYKKVIIELWTHAIGGLSENDFIVAAKIEQIKK